MPPVCSKCCRFFKQNKLLAGVNHINDLQDALIDIESIDNPEDGAAVCELFALYITQRVSEAACRPLWVCTYVFI